MDPEVGAPVVQVEDEASYGVTARSGVRFVVTPAPKDWSIPSKELDNAKKEIKNFISDSYSK